MAHNIFKPQGATSATKPDTGGAVLREVPVFGVVKDNIDPIRSGRLRVYIDDMSGQDPDDAINWSTVNYMTPFYGLTQGNAPKEGYGTYLQNPSSYGMWNSPPDIGTTVICIFINGDTNYGYWIGCVPEPEALYTVPALGSAETVVVNENEGASYGGAKKLPVANINKNNEKINESPTFYNEPKPVHSYIASVLNQQGLIRDTIRGTIGTSAQRESPSRVGWGVNTPGRPIYEGGFTDETIADAAGNENSSGDLKVIARRAGHSFVMDDGDIVGRDQLIRIRSSLGHQILMSDDGQCLHIIHANGQSWIELGKEGTIDMYATNSVNIRTQGDLNLHADNNINMHAKKDLNIYAENITTNSDKKTNVKVGTDYATSVNGKTTLKSTGAMSLKSSGEASFASSNNTFINGKKINLNTGEASTTPEDVKPIPTNAHTDTLYDSQKGWASAPAALLSIVSRAPAHAPWAAANQGVDVKINNNADANFPSNPSPAVQAANNTTTTPPAPVSPSVASTVPVTGAVSGALDKNTTTAMVGQVATIAQTVPDVAAAIKNGAGVVTSTVNGAVEKVAAIGKMAQSPQQLEMAGVIKAGSAALVDNLIQGGKTVQQALTPNLFAGKPGAENLPSYLNNTTAQVAAQVANFQTAQTQLTQAGIITGKESAGQLAGAVTAAAVAGPAAAVDAIKSAAGAVGQAITGPIAALGGAANKVLGSASNLLNAGNFAGNLASTVTGGLNSIAGSLNGLAQNLTGGAESLLNSAKGIAGSAFAAIKNSFPALKAGVPQNLKQIAEKATAAAQAVGTELQNSADKAAAAFNSSGANAASIASGAASSAINGVKSVNDLVNSATGAVGAAVTTATGAVGAAVTTATGAVTNLTTGAGATLDVVGQVTGGAQALTTAVNNAVGQVTGGIQAATNAVNNAVSTATSALSALSPGSSSSGLGLLPGAQKAVASIVDNAKGALNAIPGTAGISAALGQVTAALSSGGGLGNVASGLLDKLKGAGASLQSLASAGLPAGAAAELNSAISSLSSGGAIPIKLPVISTNTVDRSAVNAQITSVLGDTKIPPPSYAGNPATTGTSASLVALQERIKNRDDRLNAVTIELDTVMAELKTARAELAAINVEYDTAENNLPAGDPQIKAIYDKGMVKVKEISAIKTRAYDLVTKKYKILDEKV